MINFALTCRKASCLPVILVFGSKNATRSSYSPFGALQGIVIERSWRLNPAGRLGTPMATGLIFGLNVIMSSIVFPSGMMITAYTVNGCVIGWFSVNVAVHW